jgi:hypothetical protein
MVPSLNDLATDPLLPQDPLPQVNDKWAHRIFMARNPDMISIENGAFTIAISSEDLFTSVSANSLHHIPNYLNFNNPIHLRDPTKNTMKSKFEPLAKAILEQQTIIPLDPNPNAIDYSASPFDLHYGSYELDLFQKTNTKINSQDILHHHHHQHQHQQQQQCRRFNNIKPDIVIASGALCPFAFESDAKTLFVNSGILIQTNPTSTESWIVVDILTDSSGTTSSIAQVYQSHI